MNSPTKIISDRLAEIIGDALKDLNITIPAVTMLSGEFHKELFINSSTAVFIRANLTGQLAEPLPNFTMLVSAKLNVRLSDDLTGAVFTGAHERLWQVFLNLSTFDGCEMLGNKMFAVDGCGIVGSDEPTIISDDSGGYWTCGFKATLTGRVLKANQG